MQGTVELRHLAHMLRTGAGTARDIAAIREADASEIHRLADQALVMAEQLDAIAFRSNGRKLDETVTP